MKEKLDALKSQADDLASKGFVVLRQEQVYSVPDGLIIRDGAK